MNTSALIGLGAVIFVATNLDDMLLLVGFYSDPVYRPLPIFLGQLIGIGGLYAVSALAASASTLIPPAYIGLLGLAPIVIGMEKLWRQWTGAEDAAPTLFGSASSGGIARVALVTVANGGDNIATYTSVFAVHSAHDIALLGLVFLPMVALWCGLSFWLVNHPDFGELFRRHGAQVLPYVLVGLGIIVLGKADTIALLAWP